MAFNGSGSWTLPAGQPVTTGTTISSSTHNTLVTDIQTSFGTVICKDGQTTVTANLPMATFRHTGVGAAAATTDYARYDQVQNGAPQKVASVAGTDTVTGTVSPTPAAYAEGQTFRLIPAVTNTGATTLNLNSLGAGAVQSRGQALVGGEFIAGVPVEVYVSTSTPVFEILNSAPFADSRPIVVGSADPAKKVRFEVDGLTTATTRVVTIPDRNLTIGPVLGTPVASTSGTAITFTGIPAGTKRVTINFVGVSTSGTDDWLVQIGDAGGIEDTAYLSTGWNSGPGNVQSTAGFILSIGAAAAVVHGSIVLSLENAAAFTWVCSGVLVRSDGGVALITAGSKSTSAELTQVSITTTAGTDTFDAGAINISYE